MSVFTGQAKNTAASYFCKNYLTVYQKEVRPLYVDHI